MSRRWWEPLLVPVLLAATVGPASLAAQFRWQISDAQVAVVPVIVFVTCVAVVVGWLILGFSWTKPGRWPLLDSAIATLLGLVAGVLCCPLLLFFA